MSDGILLWVDDLRPAPGPGWVVAVSSAEAIRWLERWAAGSRAERLAEISFDHDLGGDDTTRPVMLWLIENDVWPDRIYVHTANPVGRQWLAGMARRYAPEGVTVRG
jgi:hypothetical protein